MSNSYNSRLFPTTLSASSSNGTALSLSYSYFANGNVNVETNGRDSGRCVPMGIASIGRLTNRSRADSANLPEGLSLLEMMLVVTVILIVASIAAPREAVSSQPSAFSGRAGNSGQATGKGNRE